MLNYGEEVGMEPLVSIITTTKNIIEKGQAEDFDLSVKMLDMQAYPNLEHIVIDGGSTDGTVDLLEKYSDKITFYSEPDKNKFDGYNKGIEKANGKYIAFLSCEDFFHDIMAVNSLVKLMEAENADFSFSPAYCRHPDDVVFLYMPSMHNVFQVVPCPRQCMFFKKEMLQKENGFDTNFNYLAEFDLDIRLVMKKYKPVYFNVVYTTYKMGEKIFNAPQLADMDAKSVFVKNYSDMCQMDDEILEKMVKISQFPKELLDKLVTFFPENDKELFYERCEQMYNMRNKVNGKIFEE